MLDFNLALIYVRSLIWTAHYKDLFMERTKIR